MLKHPQKWGNQYGYPGILITHLRTQGSYSPRDEKQLGSSCRVRAKTVAEQALTQLPRSGGEGGGGGEEMG